MSPRLLPEWHPQDAIQLTWPTPESDWASMIDHIEATLEAMVVAITRYQTVVVTIQDAAQQARLAARFRHLGVPTSRCRFAIAASDDTWARDHGPITVDRDGSPVLLDFVFTGWGGKFPAERDNRLSRALHTAGVFAAPLEARDWVLEGGGIETDGEGTLLTTSACLLNPNRNPAETRPSIERRLKTDFGVSRVLWLENGHLEGDDTDSHIDTLARFCDPSTIAYVRCDDPQDPHHAALQAMEAELQSFRREDGSPYRLLALPWPRACFDPDDGHRLPATYANFLILNDAVLVPTYADPADYRALTVLQEAFPGRDIVPIDCRAVIRQHGSLHCLTMQLPRGTLAATAAEAPDGSVL